MRHITYIIVAALLCSCNATSTADDDGNKGKKAPKRIGLNGKLYGDVDRMTINRYDIEDRFGELNKTLESTELIIFNDEGNVDKSTYTYFDEKYGYSHTYIYEYADKSYCMTTYDADGALQSKDINLLDNKGNVVTSSSYDENGELSRKWLASYDNDVISKATYYDGKGNMDTKYCYKNDGEEIIGMIKYNKEGKVEWRYDMERSGSEAYAQNIDAEGKVTNSYRLYYNKYDEVSKEIVYDADSIITTQSLFTYDDRGNLIKSETFIGEAFIPGSYTEYEIIYRE